MLKKILGIVAVLLVLGYFVFAAIQYQEQPSVQRCRKLVVEVMDSVRNPYVSTTEIRELLQRNDIDPIGKRITDINFRRIEFVVESHRLVSRAECFSSPSGTLFIHLWQYHPILRVVTADSSFYLDEEGRVTRVSFRSAADVPIASGNVDDTLQLRRLHTMALILLQDPFWDAQIQQIEVLPNGEWVLIPRIGDHELFLGLPNDLSEKMDRLKLFYRKALPNMGWERYSRISVKYKNQIICTLK